MIANVTQRRQLAGLLAGLGIALLLAVSSFCNPAESEALHLTCVEGGVFEPFVLDGLIEVSGLQNGHLTWRVIESGQLLSAIIERTLYLATPHTDWHGSETIRLEACSSEGTCTPVDIAAQVLPANDVPTIHLPDQIAVPRGDSLPDVVLAEHATDIDGDRLAFAVSGARELGATINEGILSLTPPAQDWTGVETLTISVCDASDACAGTTVQFVIHDRDALEIQLIDNAGFLIRSGELCVMIDAVYRDSVSRFPDVLTAAPPFDADVLLYTHSHPDHFDPEMAAAYLVASPNTVLVAPIDAADRVLQVDSALGERVTGISLPPEGSLSVAFNGIELSLHDIPHGGTRNISYLVTLGLHTVFHSGDVNWDHNELVRLLALHRIADANVSVALLVPRFFRDPLMRSSMRVHIASTWYVPAHVKPGSFSTYHQLADREPDIVIIDELLESRIFLP